MAPNRASIRRQRAYRINDRLLDPFKELNELFEARWIFVEEIVTARGTVLILEREESEPLLTAMN
ncbi:MAG: hypothetical protein JWQ98_1047 [Chlorobi bacterium]|nr:hypothetical protein [Chlorobiota bacterium]